MSSSPIDWRKTTGWRLGNDSNTVLGEIYEKQGEFFAEWAKHERRPHLRGKWSISWDGTFLSKVNHNLVVKLNTSCVQNVDTTERGERILFFQEPVTLTPTWMRSMCKNHRLLWENHILPQIEWQQISYTAFGMQQWHLINMAGVDLQQLEQQLWDFRNVLQASGAANQPNSATWAFF